MKSFLGRYFFYPLRAVLVIILMIINDIILPSCVLMTAPFIWIMPTKKSQVFVFRCVNVLPWLWRGIGNALLSVCIVGRLRLTKQGEIHSDRWYLLISNHQCYMDILLVDKVTNRKAPPSRFFLKKALLWQLPILSWVCWFLGYPFLDRRSKASPGKQDESVGVKKLRRDDITKTKKACDLFKIAPTMPIIYPEGTRFTKAKYEKQDSPFKYLLKPKAGGVAMILSELNKELSGIINMTINYSDEKPTVWRILSGKIKYIDVHYEILPVTEDLAGDYVVDREYRTKIQKWLNAVWADKDSLLASLKAQE